MRHPQPGAKDYSSPLRFPGQAADPAAVARSDPQPAGWLAQHRETTFWHSNLLLERRVFHK